jgi:hypothetical protein
MEIDSQISEITPKQRPAKNGKTAMELSPTLAIISTTLAPSKLYESQTFHACPDRLIYEFLGSTVSLTLAGL